MSLSPGVFSIRRPCLVLVSRPLSVTFVSVSKAEIWSISNSGSAWSGRVTMSKFTSLLIASLIFVLLLTVMSSVPL